MTLSHPHGQIYGYPFVPPRMLRAAQAAAEYAQQHGDCLRCELLRPRASRPASGSSPHRALDGAGAVRGALAVRGADHRQPARAGPARADRRRARRPGRHLPGRAAALRPALRHPGPLHRRLAPGAGPAPRDSWHLGAEIFTIRRAAGKLKYLAGSESGAAVWINDIAPGVRRGPVCAARRCRASVGPLARAAFGGGGPSVRPVARSADADMITLTISGSILRPINGIATLTSPVDHLLEPAAVRSRAPPCPSMDAGWPLMVSRTSAVARRRRRPRSTARPGGLDACRRRTSDEVRHGRRHHPVDLDPRTPRPAARRWSPSQDSAPDCRQACSRTPCSRWAGEGLLDRRGRVVFHGRAS